MASSVRRLIIFFIVAAGLSLASEPPDAQEAGQSPLTAIAVISGPELRSWNTLLERMIRDGDLRLRKIQDDPMLSGHRSERYDQYFKGVRVWGADVVRVVADGVPQTVFGMLAGAITIRVDPRLLDEDLAARFSTIAGSQGRVLSSPELVVLPTDLGTYRLTYRAVVSTGMTVVSVFIDADTGVEVMRISEIKTQTPAVGQGTGVLGDRKKLSVSKTSSAYVASDELRPPSLETFDMRYNLSKAVLVIGYGYPLSASDCATDSDNNWTDVAVVDAHVYVGWTYDYYYKRFGRSGFDDQNYPVVGIVNAATQQDALTMPSSYFGTFAVNAFYCATCGPDGIGTMFFGNGIPASYYLTGSGQTVTYLAGGLDIVAHELSHGVTDHSSNLIYKDESGALSEAFSDVMGTSVEFFYQLPGTGRGQADYLVGEDVFRALRTDSQDGIRSMGDPGRFSDPDHYSRRLLGPADDGYVHRNNGIANNAFYLAVEGGTNRTSGKAVEGVGPANRVQIERVFYRAFVYLLPSGATFSTARAATIRAAQELYGAGSAPEQAVTQAWNAVGVS